MSIFASLVKDQNNTSMQTANAFMTQDANTAGALNSPYSFTSTAFAIYPPANATTLVCWSDVAIKITEENTILAGSFEIPANTTLAFPCARMDYIGFKAAGSGVLNFYFITV